MPWIKKMHTISGKISKARLFKSVAAYLVFLPWVFLALVQ